MVGIYCEIRSSDGGFWKKKDFGLDWTGLDWTGLHWTALDCTGLWTNLQERALRFTPPSLHLPWPVLKLRQLSYYIGFLQPQINNPFFLWFSITTTTTTTKLVHSHDWPWPSPHHPLPPGFHFEGGEGWGWGKVHPGEGHCCATWRDSVHSSEKSFDLRKEGSASSNLKVCLQFVPFFSFVDILRFYSTARLTQIFTWVILVRVAIVSQQISRPAIVV